MKLNKENFLKTELGAGLKNTIEALDVYLEDKSKLSQWQDQDKYNALQKDIDLLFAEWRVYQLAVKQFFGIEYHFSRADDYFGLCTKDETDWLFMEAHKNQEVNGAEPR